MIRLNSQIGKANILKRKMTLQKEVAEKTDVELAQVWYYAVHSYCSRQTNSQTY